MPPREKVPPRTFFLNETHELSPLEKGGGGRLPDYVGISWATKAERISESFRKIIHDVNASADPLREDRFFVVAKPVAALRKRSVDRRRAPDGTYDDDTDFGGVHGKVFDRLGLDLLQVTADGDAVVHGKRERVEQLFGRSKLLDTLGPREQSRWATIDMFDKIPLSLRIDSPWLDSFKSHQPTDVVFELQPVLGRVDADRILRAISGLLHRAGEGLTGLGTDFSGRYWFRGKATQSAVRAVAKDFFSVQSIHSPLYSYGMATRKLPSSQSTVRSRVAPPPSDAKSLPCVAVLDLGTPVDHVHLADYRRGQFIPQDATTQTVFDHGSFVASRIVFGDCRTASELAAAPGRCSYYDAVVGDGYKNCVNDKIVLTAISGVRGAAPDVRVFNLSFGDPRPLAEFPEVERREKRLLMQDLDNFAFANDVLVVVAAGNSQPGVQPAPSYPNHAADSRWALGPWAGGFNTLVCGSFVSHLSASGLAKSVGWPSPFTRVGPGLCGAPIPTFGAAGGNCNAQHGFAPGLGVWGFNGEGLAEDRSGTSQAAPLLAREAALTLAALRAHCATGTQPFGVTARAFLALTAKRTSNDSSVAALAARTLGLGLASSAELTTPRSGAAIVLWQGIVENSRDVLRVQFPIPRAWLKAASSPVLRMMVSYDPPVNEAATALWACRAVKVTLHTSPDARGITGSHRLHRTYPLFLKEFKLAKFAPGAQNAAGTDLWILEVAYDEIFDYPPGMTFDARQRVALAAELVDVGANPVDPQPAMQALPAVATMNRLSVQQTPLRVPLIVRTR